MTTITFAGIDGVKYFPGDDKELRMRLTILAAQNSRTITVILETRT